MSRQRYTAEQVCEAIRRAGGVIAVAAQALGCDRKTVYNYAKRYTTVQEAMDEANETNLDVAEAGLAAFMRGQVTETIDGVRTTRSVDDRTRLDALKFYLRTKGRLRGYGDRMEVTGRDGGPVQVKGIDFSPHDDD